MIQLDTLKCGQRKENFYRYFKKLKELCEVQGQKLTVAHGD